MIDRKTILIGLAVMALLVIIALVLPPILSGGSTGSAASVAEVTRLVEQTVEVTRIVEIVVTATPLPPTPTPENTATPTASPTPDVLVVLPDGFTPWCMPNETTYSPEDLARTGEMPQNARAGEIGDSGLMELIIQVQSCTLMFNFNQPVPEGTVVKIYDLNPSPFLTIPMTVVSENPTKAFVTVVNPYIIDPPYWSIEYRIEVVDPTGQILWLQPVVFRRSGVIGYCWDGSLPDPVTYQCHNPGEAHPWDPWYGWEYPPGYEPPPLAGQ